ncbi:hypothetical protein F5880DRAFT_1589227 [Lentinula raphanica]|nr:hypothetical protein F5880DRAFT_1589227 [Lentinula raphanica]
MKAVAFASVVALVSGALAQDFTINTPGSLTECEPVLLSWTGGKGAVYPSGSPTTNLETLTTTNSTSFTWEVNVASGQSIGFSVLDSTGEQKQTAAVPIQAGSTTDCLNQSLSGSAGPTSSSSGSGSATSTGSGTTTTGTSPNSSGSSTSTSSSSSSTNTASNGASSQVAQFGVAGIVGAVIGAFFA